MNGVLICLLAFFCGYGLCGFINDCNGVKVVLRSLWQFPQMFLGLIVWFVTSRRTSTREVYLNKEETIYYEINYNPWKFKTGLSLGPFIFVPKGVDNNMLLHEFGHSKQSLYLGPLYLLIIGIPSIIWAGLYRFEWFNMRWSYYDFFTERWADELGEVKR